MQPGEKFLEVPEPLKKSSDPPEAKLSSEKAEA
jgi:hypothetical protein